MNYNNPVIKGFYPDPSVCKVEDKYYLVCSSFQYFPGVPLFHSKDLVNWTQIGHCLTRESQLNLDRIGSSGGVYAATIRHHEGRFYMVTTNVSIEKNFYVWTDDIQGEWSDPVFVDQGGIDPSFYFEDGKAYFMSNRWDENGAGGIVQCEIDINTGKKLTPSRVIWQGTGGRYLEGPHLYKINGMYYLVAAEGGTEYGHMVTYGRSKSLDGPFEAYPYNPVLTNRNLGGYEIQGVGHGDLIRDNTGNWWMLHLGFRQISKWLTYHHLGREVFLTPVHFNTEGWFTAGSLGTARRNVTDERSDQIVLQKEKRCYTFENTEWDKDWCFLRLPVMKNYLLDNNKIRLMGTEISLDAADSPTWIGLRQKDFKAVITCDVKIQDGEAGITLYMDENHHYDLYIRRNDNSFEVIVRLCIGNIKSIEHKLDLSETKSASLRIEADPENYRFFTKIGDKDILLGDAFTRYLSSEVAGGFTGVMIGLYAYGQGDIDYAEFTDFKCEYVDSDQSE